jgi:hypothetical protein
LWQRSDKTQEINSNKNGAICTGIFLLLYVVAHFVSATRITCMHQIAIKFFEARPQVQANSESK